MKSWFKVDDFMVAFIAAVGYGLGYSVPCAFGAPDLLCLVLCFVVGLSIELIAEKIIFSRFTQVSNARKAFVFLAFILFYAVFNIASQAFLGESLFDALKEEFGWVLLFAVLGFVISMVKLKRRKAKVRTKYGNGEEGFRFNSEERAYIEGLNQSNREILGEYDESLAVKTRAGVFVGEKENGVVSFDGIPYAKAPVGSLRWKAPEALPDSNKVYEAKHYGASAIQVNYRGNPLGSHAQSEDCLYLNVYKSDEDSSEPKPVVVYFHGGDFTFGGSANPLWEMQGFVNSHPDVIAVSFNYRLGFLGFIDFSGVPGGDAYPDAANLGLLDQIAALEWVKENISAFGGDPNRITVMGDDAGGISISLLAVCERAKGLFQNAVILSGNPAAVELEMYDSKEVAMQLLESTSSKNMDDLLALPEDKLGELMQKLKHFLAMPQVDGKLIPKDVHAAYKNGTAKDIRFLSCASKDDMTTYSSSIGRGFSEEVFADAIDAILAAQTPERAKKLKSYLADEIDRVGTAKASARFLSFWFDEVSLLRYSQALRTGGSGMHVLFWDVDSVVENLGSGSVDIVNTVLGNQDAAVAYGSVVNESVQDVLQAFILKFIHEDSMELYNNEIDGINAIDWNEYPDVLLIADDSISLQSAEELLPESWKLVAAEEV